MTVPGNYVRIIAIIMEDEFKTKKYFYIVSGNWSTVVNADDRSSALKEAFRSLLKDKSDKSIAPVIACLNVDDTVKDLSLEDTLKFIPTAVAAYEIGKPRLAAAIKSLFSNE